jgi:hypothetical protein
MASGFPASIDNFTDPLSNSALNSPSHSAQHTDLNDAVEKIETYMGLVKVIPTGATNGTVSSTGTVTVGSAVTSVTVSGAFSSLYDNYRIVYSGGVGSGLITLRVNLGASTTGYYSVVNYANFTALTTPLSAGDNNNAYWEYMGYASTNHASSSFDLLNPFGTGYTTYHAAAWPAITVAGTSTGIHQVASSYADFKISTNTGTITGGKIRVYGYRN